MRSNTMHRYLSVYSIVNIFYLLGLLVISLISRLYPELSFPRFLAIIPISLISYLLAKLTLCHIIYYIVYSLVYVIKFICDKYFLKAIFTLCISILGILLNLYWIMNGKPLLVNWYYDESGYNYTLEIIGH